MTDIESNIEPHMRFNDQVEEILLLQLYPIKEVYRAEMCKICCSFLCMTIAIVFIIIAASQRCIYNCKK